MMETGTCISFQTWLTHVPCNYPKKVRRAYRSELEQEDLQNEANKWMRLDTFCQPAHRLEGFHTLTFRGVFTASHDCLVEINFKLMGFWHFGKINAHLREYETYAHMYSKPPEKKNHRVLTQNSKHVIDSLILLVINPHCFGIISQQQKTRLPIFGQRVRPWHPCHIFPVAVWHATMFDPNYPVGKCFLKRKVSCNSICQKALLWWVSFMERVITKSLWCIL